MYLENIEGRLFASFVGALTTAALIIKVKYAILGIFAGVANIIPYFDPLSGLYLQFCFAA